MFASVSRLCRPVVRQVLRQRNAWTTAYPCAACVQVRGLATKGEATDVDHSRITNQEWEKRLKPEQYFVTREKGTEAPFTGKYVNHNEKGVYTCVCCGSELFSSEAKFDSGSGWPSFHMALGGDGKDPRMSNVLERPDNSMGMVRTEVLCKKCDAHLGHVFEDGPQPTGLRYCINSVALQFIGQGK